MRGDANTQADVLNTILEQEGKTLENNLFARQQMSKLLGMDEAALSRALQKKSILEKLPGGEALFDKTGDALLEAARGMEGVTEQQLKELAEVEDQRTTDDILKQILTVLSEGRPGTKAILENQGGYVAGASARAKQQASGASGQQMLINLSESSLKTLGGALLGIEGSTKTLKTIVNSKDAILNAEKATISTGGETPKETQDLVSMPGTSGRVLTGPFGAFSLDDRDMIMAGDPNKMTGGGGSAADFMKAAAIIVAAINTQTSQLKQDSTFRPGLTGARY